MLQHFYIVTLESVGAALCVALWLHLDVSLEICFMLRSSESSFAYREQCTNLYPYPLRFL